MTGEGAVALADYVRRQRLTLGLTQETLAERAGLTVDTVGALERGQRRRLYPQTARALADALGLTLIERAELTELAAGRARQDPAIPRPTPTVPPSTGARAPNLPATATSFVGRDAELERVTALVAAEPRLLTLTGPGGTGKTRLALEAVSLVGRRFSDGVWFIELAPLAAGASVAGAVAVALRVREVRGHEVVTGIVAALREQTALLVLDNCEHVLDASAALVSALLPACPGLTIVVTSREPLRVRGEQVYPVPSLPLPPIGPSVATLDPESLCGFAAVRLFVDRARAVAPAFSLTEANSAAVVDICRRLDGLPLAIELAAARTDALAPQQIAARLDDRFQLVTESAGGRPPRHQTLRALLDWSYDLLAPAEQALLRRLSVFAGGWDLEAAESVCGADGIKAADVLELLLALVDKSLVVAEVQQAVDRYRLLESVREYAVDKLEAAGEAAVMHDRHAAYLLHLARAARRALVGPAQAEWVQRLEMEHHNLRAALARTLAGGDADTALRLCALPSMF